MEQCVINNVNIYNYILINVEHFGRELQDGKNHLKHFLPLPEHFKKCEKHLNSAREFSAIKFSFRKRPNCILKLESVLKTQKYPLVPFHCFFVVSALKCR